MASPKDITELRNQLLESFDAVRQDPRRAVQTKEISNCAGKIMQSVAVQLEYAHLRGEEPDIPFLGKTSGKPIRNGGIKMLSSGKDK